jgi:hypothetical protein
VDAGSSAAPLGALSRDAFLLRMVVQQIVDGLIGHPAGDGDGSADAVAGLATVAGCRATAVIEKKSHVRHSSKRQFRNRTTPLYVLGTVPSFDRPFDPGQPELPILFDKLN